MMIQIEHRLLEIGDVMMKQAVDIRISGGSRFTVKLRINQFPHKFQIAVRYHTEIGMTSLHHPIEHGQRFNVFSIIYLILNITNRRK